MLNTPIVEDQLAARIAVDLRTHQSLVDVPASVEDEIGTDPEKDTHRNYRAKLLFEPSAVPDLSTKLTYTYNFTQRLFRERVDAPFEALRSSNTVNSTFRNETHALTFNSDYSLSEFLQIRNTISYSDVDSDFLIPINGNGPLFTDLVQWNVETVGEYDNPDIGIKGRVGASYNRGTSKSVTAEADDQVLDVDGVDRNVGVFGEVTWSPRSFVDFTIGARYQMDEANRDGSALFPFGRLNLIADIDVDQQFQAFLPRASIALHPTDNVTVGALIAKGYNPGGTFLRLGGLIPPGFGGGGAVVVEFEKETSLNYELFWRTQWLDDRLKINGNLFFTQFEDLQAAFGTTPLDTTIENIPEARNYGLEAEFSYAPTDQWELIASLGLLKTEVVEGGPGTSAREGNEFARAPELSANFALNYRPIDGLVVGVEGVYFSDYYTDADNNQFGLVDDRFVANAKVSYEYENYKVFAAVTNVFDEFYLLDSFGTIATPGDPLEVTAGIHVKF